MQANRPTAITHELRLRQYQSWCNRSRNSAKYPDDGDDAIAFLRPIRGHCREAHTKEVSSRKKRWRWASGEQRAQEDRKIEEMGRSSKAKKKRPAQAMLRYWLRRAAHPKADPE